jgi:hypothetical protein
MKIEDFRKLLHAHPFKPFVIYCADGGQLRVAHEDFVAVAPTGREVIVYQPDGDYQVVDIMLVTRLKVSGRNGSKHSS